MFKILRMICAIVAAACAVACVIVAVLWGMLPFWGCLAGGVFFFVLCLLFKFLQEDKEGSGAPSAPESGGADEPADAKDGPAEADGRTGAAPDGSGADEDERGEGREGKQ